MDTLIFVRKRLIHMIPVLFGIVLVVFLMVRLIPGDPARIMLGTHATEEKLADLRATLGLDQPIYQQFVLFMGNVLRGDLGTSLVFRRPVAVVIAERLPPTLFLVTYAAILSLFADDSAGPAGRRAAEPAVRPRRARRRHADAVDAELLAGADPAHHLRRAPALVSRWPGMATTLSTISGISSCRR